ncbi:hypothetical protein SK128_018364, partial [Halocaridina rubra]
MRSSLRSSPDGSGMVENHQQFWAGSTRTAPPPPHSPQHIYFALPPPIPQIPAPFSP